MSGPPDVGFFIWLFVDTKTIKMNGVAKEGMGMYGCGVLCVASGDAGMLEEAIVEGGGDAGVGMQGELERVV